jgi:hypothetical protein
MTTASAPAGIGAPVKMRRAVRGASGWGAEPARASPSIASAQGPGSEASAAAIAYPSIAL